MDKKTFTNVAYMITKECQKENLTVLCNSYGITPNEFNEFVTDLALRGFKDKYNQHNHPEHNKNN